MSEKEKFASKIGLPAQVKITKEDILGKPVRGRPADTLRTVQARLFANYHLLLPDGMSIPLKKIIMDEVRVQRKRWKVEHDARRKKNTLAKRKERARKRAEQKARDEERAQKREARKEKHNEPLS